MEDGMEFDTLLTQQIVQGRCPKCYKEIPFNRHDPTDSTHDCEEPHSIWEWLCRFATGE
jgi:hypothetical protein